jgi:hypothetical protein
VSSVTSNYSALRVCQGLEQPVEKGASNSADTQWRRESPVQKLPGTFSAGLLELARGMRPFPIEGRLYVGNCQIDRFPVSLIGDEIEARLHAVGKPVGRLLGG